MKSQFLVKLQNKFDLTKIKFLEKRPEIYLGIGIASGFATVVLACIATTKAGKVVDTAKEQLDAIHEANETGKTKAGDIYTKEDHRKDVTLVYVQTSWQFVKLYGPAALMGAASILSVLAGHKVLKKENAKLALAAATLDQTFREYRDRVADRFGDQVEKEIRYNLKAKEVTEEEEDENGKKVKKKTTVYQTDDPNYDPSKYSVYARIFTEGATPEWEPSAMRNKSFILGVQQTAQRRLEAKGYLFLNEVYEMLGFRVSDRGCTAGWIWTKDPSKQVGDDRICFGLERIDIPTVQDFHNGYERNIWLDFNVIGDIRPYLDSIEQYPENYPHTI